MRLYKDEDNYQAFEEIYRRYSGKLLGYINHRVYDGQIATEVFQEIFLKFHRNRKRFDESIPLSAWIFVIARSVMIDGLRKQKKFSTQIEYSDESHSGESDVTLDLDLGFLNPSERELIEKRFFEGQEYAEMAASLSQSEVSMRKRVSRVLSKIRKQFQGK